MKQRQGATLERPTKTLTMVLEIEEESRSVSGSESEKAVGQEKLTAEHMKHMNMEDVFCSDGDVEDKTRAAAQGD